VGGHFLLLSFFLSLSSRVLYCANPWTREQQIAVAFAEGRFFSLLFLVADDDAVADI